MTTAMRDKLRILNLEDTPNDTELIEARLDEDGVECEVVRVETKEEYIHALEERSFDLILADYSLPGFDGLSALELAVEKSPGIPFIFVSGVIGEDLAIESMKRGATDYVLKNRLQRLGPSVKRAILEFTERADRRKAEEELRKAHAELERRVAERTAELSKLTASLREEIRERRQAEEELARSRAEFQAILNSLSDPVVFVDTDRRIRLVNPAFTTHFGYTFEEVHGRTTKFLYFDPDDYQKEGRRRAGGVKHGQQPGSTVQYRRKDGSYFWSETTGVQVKDAAGKILGYAGITRDITERRQREQERERLLADLQRTRTLLSEAEMLSHTGAWEWDLVANTLTVSDEWLRIHGMRTRTLDPGELLRIAHPDDREAIRQSLENARKGVRPYEMEHRIIRQDTGEEKLVIARGQYVLDTAGKVVKVYGFAQDITERKRLEGEIRHMAHHDSLTGLPNRRLFHEVANVEIAQARRHASKLAILFIDLDRFKEVNDTLGHEIGDLLLKETATRLKAVTRMSDTIARIGGDEFNIVISDIGHPEYASEVARKILLAIRVPFMIKGLELNTSTSIGISIFPDDGEKIDELLQYADIAMYYAKEHGRNTFQFYSPVINTRSLERVKFENALRRAIEREEFRLYFQPLVDIKAKRIVSVEALIRWQHPERGVLLPEQFFPAAEDVGLMPEIEEWVLKNVGKQIISWRDQGSSPVCVTVNLSAQQFQNSDLLGRISAILEQTGLRPECLEIEITEGTAMHDIENSIRKIEELKKVGVRVSIDDFGTGYSSLNHLKRLPVQKLKIDKSFIRDLVTNADDRKIVTAVLLLAHSMDLKVVAEGVENQNQLLFLGSQQCDEAQGYFFSKPLPPEQLKELVSA